VICDLLGHPAGRAADFRGWSNSLLARPTAAAAGRAIGELTGYLTDLIGAHRQQPGVTLLTALVNARDRGWPGCPRRTALAAFLLLFAGYENSTNLIGNGVLVLLSHPEQAHLPVRRDPAGCRPRSRR